MSNVLPDEETPLLRHHHHSEAKPSRRFLSRWRRHLTADVSQDRADLILLFCYLITGLLDSASISVWGSFVSMQTGKLPFCRVFCNPLHDVITPFAQQVTTDTNPRAGNTVYFGLGLASPSDSTRWIKSGVSLLSFCLGSLVFSRFHRFFSPKRRWVLAASFTAQLLLTATAASLVTGTGPHVDKDEMGWQVLVPIALVAFQSCGQAVVSRALKYNTLTSVVLTSIYCDLFSDAELLALRNVERNRRTAAPVLLLLGAFVGGRFAHSSLGVAGALWAASVLKAVVVAVWLVWPADRDCDER
jgi:uncharacterized membrane protein YoaK (UPF0700 family)